MNTLLIIYVIGFIYALVMNLHGLVDTAWFWCILLSFVWPIDMIVLWGMRRYYNED